jgi:hypothetical protein
MFTWGSRYLFGMALAAFVGAVAYGLITGGGPVGVVSLGYKGGVGEHLGYTLLIGASVASLLLGIVEVITRDGDAEDMADLAGSERILTVRPPAGPSITSPLAAFGIACLALSLSVSAVFLYLGLAVLVIVGIEWTVQAWSERATGDDTVNAVIRRRILGPFEVPMLGLLAIAVVVLGLSRILLAVSEVGSVIVAVVVAGFIFFSAVLISKSRAPRAIIAAIVTVGAVAVLAGGVIGAVAGERDFHHGEEQHSQDGGAVVEEGE